MNLGLNIFMEDFAKLITNCSKEIDCDGLVSSIIDLPGKDVIPMKAVWDERNPGYGQLFDLWEKSNVWLGSAKWTNYYPGKDYDDSTIGTFEKMLGVKHIRSWISRIDPGYCTPWHWDTDDHEHEYIKLGKLVRFSCHISQPQLGHVFLIGKECHYFQEQGEVYEWSHHRAWHAGMNCGLAPKFMLQFLGYV